jgi:hypothetical protein
MSRRCGVVLFVTLVASSCSHDKPSDSANGSGSAAAAPPAQRKLLGLGHWSAHRFPDGWCVATPDAACAADVVKCDRSFHLGLPCPPDAPASFTIAEVDFDKCVIEPSRKEVPCPDGRPVLDSWMVRREGKACWTEEKPAYEIDCPPDNAPMIEEIKPGICQTAPIDHDKTPNFASKPVPCPPEYAKRAKPR